MILSSAALEAYVRSFPSHHEFEETWHVQGLMKVRIGLANEPPPSEVSSSVLAIVFDKQSRFLFLGTGERSGNISHFLVGGRSEPGETGEQAVMREVGEETGWVIRTHGIIGYRHFHQTEPFRPGSDRPYPDFVQYIYAARAVRFEQKLIVSGDLLPSKFLDFEQAVEVTDPDHRPLLLAAAARSAGIRSE